MNKNPNPEDRFDMQAGTNAFSPDDAKKLFLQEFIHAQDVVTTKLSGGFSNANFLIRSSIGSYVIRFYTLGLDHCKTEADILRFATDHSISVPEIVKEKIQFKNHFSNILKYIEGTPLSELLFDKAPIPDSVFYKVGRELALIHSVPFDRHGLLGPDLKITYDTTDSNKVFDDFILAPLNGRAGIRLGPLKEKLLKLLEHKSQIGITSKPCLVHCDFNPKNILVSPTMDKVAILDWEFAMAGERLIDFGNFFRFENDFTEPMMANVLKGYESILGPLPPNWRADAKIHDLISMISFLNSSDEKPKTFATAIEIIESTIVSTI